ncbi:MAG: hypothetical protein AAFN78_08605 [Pseudomonadota bacterium]
MPALRVVADISGHGFGHLSQTAAVLDALGEMADVDLVVRTTHPQAVVSQFMATQHRMAPPPPDATMVMTGPSRVDVPATLAAYAALHSDLDAVVAVESERLAALAPDVVLANVPYTSLLAASAANVPSVGYCSLNWYDILSGYCADWPDAQPILDAIRRAYQAATVFLRPMPAMPMAWLPRAMSVGPVARRAASTARPAMLPTDDDKALVLLSLGGIRSDLSLDSVPALPGVHWIIATQQQPVERDDVTSLDDVGAGFLDLLPHVDAIVAKTGYGSFAEAAAFGVRVLYASRPDWPEAPALETWIEENATAARISQAQLYDGDYAAALQELLARPRSAPVPASGAQEAARCLMELALRSR